MVKATRGRAEKQIATMTTRKIPSTAVNACVVRKIRSANFVFARRRKTCAMHLILTFQTEWFLDRAPLQSGNHGMEHVEGSWVRVTAVAKGRALLGDRMTLPYFGAIFEPLQIAIGSCKRGVFSFAAHRFVSAFFRFFLLAISSPSLSLFPAVHHVRSFTSSLVRMDRSRHYAAAVQLQVWAFKGCALKTADGKYRLSTNFKNIQIYQKRSLLAWRGGMFSGYTVTK